MNNIWSGVNSCDRVLVDVVSLGFFTNVECDLLTFFIDFDTDNLRGFDELPFLVISMLNEEAIAVLDHAARDSENSVVQIVNVGPMTKCCTESGDRDFADFLVLFNLIVNLKW